MRKKLFGLFKLFGHLIFLKLIMHSALSFGDNATKILLYYTKFNKQLTRDTGSFEELPLSGTLLFVMPILRPPSPSFPKSFHCLRGRHVVRNIVCVHFISFYLYIFLHVIEAGYRLPKPCL